jgi:cardiolipin synthase
VPIPHFGAARDLAPHTEKSAPVNRARHLPRSARRLMSFAPLLAALGVSACATLPQIDVPTAASQNGTIRMSGARGPLSQRDARAVLAQLAASAPNAGALERHLAVEQAVAESPLLIGNQVQILQNGEQTFPAVFAAIRNAKRYVDLEYYIFEDVSSGGVLLSDLLIAKRQAGVEINLIYDAVGSVGTPADFVSRLQAAGIRVVQFNPLNPLKSKAHYSINDRDHRKILIADGALAVLGGVNLSSSYESAPHAFKAQPETQGTAGARAAEDARDQKPQELWRDIDIEISGPAVGEVDKLFIDHWNEQHGAPLGGRSEPRPNQDQGDEVVRIIGSSPSQLQSRYYATVLSALRSAERNVWITAAYFVPTPQERDDLKAAARRGIDVRLLLPSHSDSAPALAVQQSYYAGLLKAGVKIYERGDGVLHSKTIVVDTVWSMTGSSNFDQRSVLFNDEIDAVVIGKSTGERLESIFQDGLLHARPIDLATWRQRSLAAKFRERFWRMWEKML